MEILKEKKLLVSCSSLSACVFSTRQFLSSRQARAVALSGFAIFHEQSDAPGEGKGPCGQYYANGQNVGIGQAIKTRNDE